MNTTATAIPPLIDPTLEAWGAKLAGYLSAMGMHWWKYL